MCYQFDIKEKEKRMTHSHPTHLQKGIIYEYG